MHVRLYAVNELNGILNFTDSAVFGLNKICGNYPRQNILERKKNQYLLTSLEMEL